MTLFGFSKVDVTGGPRCSDVEKSVSEFAEDAAAEEEAESCRSSREETASAAERLRRATG